MVKTSRIFATGILLLAAGLCGAETATPVYFNYFGSQIQPDRYTRNMGALVDRRIVDEPSRDGERSLEISFIFSEKELTGPLLWDLSPVRISRIRFNVYNPNPAERVIRVSPGLMDTDRRVWNLTAKGILLKSKEWTAVDLKVEDTVGLIKGTENLKVPEPKDASFMMMHIRFEVGSDFKGFGKPLNLYLNGMECY